MQTKPTAYDIRNFGAVGDGTTLNTSAIQTTIDICNINGGGRVVIPAGTWLSGTILMKDNVELYLGHGSTLLGSKRHEDYPRQPTPKFRSHKDIGGFYALIYAEGVNNIAITGSGTINGQGKYQKPRYGGGDQDGRPRNIVFITCRDIRIEGIRMRDSGMWNQHYLNCDNLIIRGLDVYNHVNRNNDAVDIDGCRRVTISDCHFDTDDDGITLKSTGSAPTEDVVITNCTVSSHCNAIKAGTESSGGFRNITISNCVVTPSRHRDKPIFSTPIDGITGISLIIVDGGIMENVTINNIVIDGPMAPIYIRLGNRARKYTEGIPKPKIGKIRNIAISNVVAHSHGNFGSSITGLPDHYIENISLSNIQLFAKGNITANDFRIKVSEDERGYPQPTAWGNLPAFGLFLRHVRGVTLNGVMLGVDEPDVRCPIWADDVQQLSIRQTRISGPIISGPFVKGIGLTEYDVEKPLLWTGKVVTISE
ncbi:MAG: glycoside hydrolase family 28 protein [Sedimentisphaerales bacterium]|nr:glycoside hydrolase family 28 protein [Sedimentisphaerales bacterium]